MAALRQSLSLRRIAPVLAVLVGIVFAGTAAPAHGALLPGLLPGVVSPSDTPSKCDTSASNPFQRWGDSSNYVLVPGGSFEGGATGWTLDGGANVRGGNEPFYVHGAKDHQSLYLPAGSSATTPAMCFDFADWHMRFFSVSSGSPSSTVRVSIVVKSLLGVLSVLDGGMVSASSTWAPSPQVAMLLTNVTGLLATDSVSFRFSPDASGSLRIDDVYIDPWKDT